MVATVTTCKRRLAAGQNVSGVYAVPVERQTMNVYCEQTRDGGGWMLAYSNANNWADEGASSITSVMVSGNSVARWYDSRWALQRAADNIRLGKVWNGNDPLTPEIVGSNNLKALYDAGFTQVRFEFIQGSDGQLRSGWCDTAGWDWSATSAQTLRCSLSGPNKGSGNPICLGRNETCDQHNWNLGWIGHITLGDQNGDHAYQSAPNHIHLGKGCDGVGFPCTVSNFVIGWGEKILTGNATGKDYQVRIWLREP